MMDEGMLGDLFPFILMFGGMIVMGIVGAIVLVRQSMEGTQNYNNDQLNNRDQEGSAGYGNSMQG